MTTTTDTGLLEELATEEVLPEGSQDRRYRYSRWNLRFMRPGVEETYLAYRNPVILGYLRWLLLAGAAMVFAGSLVDFTRLDEDSAWLLTGIRIAVAVGMLIAWWLTRTAWVQQNLQTFIGIGASLIHVVWLVTVPIVGERIVEYVGVLPINIMLTFLVSGLMFRWARWVALFAGFAYCFVLIAVHPAPGAPILYLLLGGLYAGFASYVAERARREAWSEAQLLDAEKANSERLLLNVLPPSIANRMKKGEELIADRFDEAAVLFADIVGFTRMSSTMDPTDLVEILDEIFRRFDIIAEEMDLEKIKTIGDCYMVACGLPSERDTGAWRIADAALRMQAELLKVAEKRERDLKIRVGIHCGPVVAGVIGRSKFIYDLWGDTVNLAARMETAAPEGGIQISEAMRDRLCDDFRVEYRGEFDMKGKGMQKAWLLEGRRG